MIDILMKEYLSLQKGNGTLMRNSFISGNEIRYFFLILLFLFFTLFGSAATYYVSNSGNDSNPGTSESLPWQTLTKVNTMSFKAGDQILFKRGILSMVL